HLERAAVFSKRSIAMLDPEKQSNAYSYIPRSQFVQMLKKTQRYYRDTYAYILHVQGKEKEALKQVEKAVGNGDMPAINQRYIKYLLINRAYKKASEKAQDFIAEGQAADSVKTYFKTAYVKQNGSDKGFRDLLAKSEKKAHDKALKSLQKELLNKDVPGLQLTDQDGNEVQIADFKGKTLILDFWATWCGPCRASFPGMEKAVNYYSDNPDVRFFFVNTFQREPQKQRRQKVADFI